jgi:osmoprotectant transport system ATP-binding protein
VLRLEAVSKRYGRRDAVQPLDFEVPAGRTTVLIGPSGCGKSTLLRLMCGLIEPSGGAVRFDGEPVTAESAPALRQRMGYVIQDGGLFPHLTARRNVTLMADHLDRPTDGIAARVNELRGLVDLPEGSLDRYPAQLSGGQRQRVSLMRALMLDPPLLLLDEPLGALDPMIRASLQADLHGIFGRLGKTVVLVTHDLAEAAFFGHRIVLMQDGRVVQAGDMSDLLERPAEPFVTEFVQAQRGLHEIVGAAS